MNDEELLAIYDAERDAYYRYLGAMRGEGRTGRVSPALVRATRKAWNRAWRAREEAGLGWAPLVALLERSGRGHRKDKR